MEEGRQASMTARDREVGKRRETKVEDRGTTPAIARAVVLVAGSWIVIAIPAAAIAPMKRRAGVDLGVGVQFDTRKRKNC